MNPPLESATIVVVSQRLGAIGPQERRIEACGAVLRQASLWNGDEIRANAAGARAAIVGAVEPFDAGAFGSLPQLEVIVRRGVGVDNIDLTAATQLGIIVAHVPDASVEEVSDHALALLLAIERRLIPLDRAVHAGAWQRDPAAIAGVRKGIRRLGTLTLGVIGFGRIGRALARKSRSVYEAVIVADPLIDGATAIAEGVELVDLEVLLETADHISVHAPLVAATAGLLDGPAFARMRPGAVIVNTSRGGLVDEAALVDALRSGRPEAAGLDVTQHEPLPASDPLLLAEGVVLTAHSAATSTVATAELARRSVDAVIDFLEGRLPEAVANPAVLASPVLRAAGLRRRS